MPDTINGYVLGQAVTMRVGDKVGLLETGRDWYDTFAGTEVEILSINDQSVLTVRTHNGHELRVTNLEVAPALPKKRGRPHVKRADGEKVIATSITLPESDIAYLKIFNPRNLSAAIRILVRRYREIEDERELADHFRDAF